MRTAAMASLDAATPGERRAEATGASWKPLRYYAIYRLILAGLFAVLVITARLPAPFGGYAPQLFAWTSYAYVAFSLLAGSSVSRRRPALPTQVQIQVIGDILFITVLMHASGGIESGLGMLLVATIAAGSVLTAGRTAGLFAAVATIALLIEQSYLLLSGPGEQINYTQAGMLGATLFATAVLAHTLARRIRESEALAARRGVDLANMAQLAQYIIENLQTGILVVDGDNHIRLTNSTARARLGGAVPQEIHIHTMAPELYQQLTDWRMGRTGSARVLELNNAQQPLLPRFMPLGEDRQGATLIFLEDAEAASQQVQQLKLASLGRLSASIAHEIRNPLGAISHAGELLGESPALEAGDVRLVRIILDQSKRVNAIVENVLQLGRRGNAAPESFLLAPWLKRFITEFCTTSGLAPADIALHAPDEEAIVRFDTGHLHQILWNLCQNAQRHAPADGSPKVEIVVDRGADGATVLAVRDHGAGIAAEVRPHIFDPFFTTDPQGTGLGLYIARELAEYNRAKLVYAPPPDGGSQFRILFAKP